MGMSATEVKQMLGDGQRRWCDADGQQLPSAVSDLSPNPRTAPSQEYGAILDVRVSDGSPFEWSSVSDFYLRNAAQAKGVFLDRGAHTVDVVCWWLSDQLAGNRPQIIDARHDAMGGAEARFHVNMAFGKHRSSARVQPSVQTRELLHHRMRASEHHRQAISVHQVRHCAQRPNGVDSGRKTGPVSRIRLAALGKLHRGCPGRCVTVFHGCRCGAIDCVD